MYKWAKGRGIRIGKPIQPGSRIVWLKGGGVRTQKDRISIIIIIRRPQPQTTGGDGTAEVICETSVLRHEPTFKGVIKSPMGAVGSPLAESRFECQVGDVIILEGAEQLLVRPPVEGDTGPRDICMVLILHQTSLEEGATGGSSM